MRNTIFLFSITILALLLGGAALAPVFHPLEFPFLVSPEEAPAVAPNKTTRVSDGGAVVHTYSSDIASGLIGVSAGHPIDDPYDNVFHVALDEAPQAGDRVWLSYELKGVQDHSAVARSINDRQAVGGCIGKVDDTWSNQTEQIAAAWLHEGDNTIRFSLPEKATHHYEIKNLRVIVEKTPGERVSQKDRELVVNQASTAHFGDKAYLKGYLTGFGAIGARLFAGEQEVALVNGEYEYLAERPASAEDFWKIELRAVYRDGTEERKTVVFNSAEQAGFYHSMATRGLSQTQLFVPRHGNSLEAFGAAIDIPEQALTKPAAISITALRDVDLPALDPDLVNVTAQHKGYRFLPDGLQFEKNVRLTLGYDPALIPAGYTEQDIRTYYFDDADRRWKMVRRDSLDTERREVTSLSNHFTDYINGIIKVPESPQTQGYKQTEIKDIKASPASAGIVFIEPPAANNMGTANLSFPIKVPAGRQGLQPQLAIQYNSEGGNGWMGVGWDLAVPSVNIDTRWGVPRFDPNLETETYLLGGDMLTPVAHRAAPVSRVADRSFNPRIESAFQKIIRHGNSPKEYYWEVVSKEGVHSWYGGSPNGFEANAVLLDKDKNVAQWCLREVRDPNDNFMRYHYFHDDNPGIPGSAEPGSQIYLQQITYTGHGNTEGKYKVRFVRDRDLNIPARADVQINGRLGFKQVTADLLSRIEITFDGNPVRSYELLYEEGAFYKSLLTLLIEEDRDKQEFYRHEFDYYDEVRDGGSYQPFASQNPWSVPNDGINGGMLNPIPGFGDEISVLGGSSSFQYGFGGAFTIGLPLACGTKNLSVGVNFNFSESESEGQMAFLDINGDNLPDKVFRQNDTLWFEPNLSAKGIKGFGDKRLIQNIKSFSRSQTRSTATGVEANFYAFVGRTTTKSKTKTDVYFADFNGDGLIDLANRGTVWFNHIDSLGNPVFTTDSEDTPCKISNNVPLDTSVLAFDPMEQQDLIDENPLHDVVRMWRPPYPGMVSIAGSAQLFNDPDPKAKQYDQKDGVMVSIEHKGKEISGGPHLLTNPDDAVVINISNIPVDTSEHIYFRVQSIFDGAYDKVIWDPKIVYSQIDLPNTLPGELDANGKPVHEYGAKEDFLIATPQTISMPYSGKVRLQGTFSKPITSDSVTVEVVRMHENTDPSILYLKGTPWQTADSFIIDTTIDVQLDDDILFKVKSATNIDWKALSFQPSGYYTAAFDTMGKPVPVLNAQNEPLEVFCPAVDYTMFNYPLFKTEVFIPDNNGVISVSPRIQFPMFYPGPIPPIEGDITLSIKGKNKLYADTTFHVSNNTIPPGLPNMSSLVLQANVPAYEPVFIEYYIASREQAEKIARDYLMTSIQFNGDDIGIQPGMYTTLSESEFIFGNLYRGWGQFVYNGNRDRAKKPIDRNELKIDSDLKSKAPDKDKLKSMNDPLTVDFPYNPAKENFFMMAADAKRKLWVGLDQFTLVGADTISSSRLGDDDILLVDLPSAGSDELDAPRKVSISKATTWAGGGGYAGISGTYTHSNNSSTTNVEVMDLTGDRFPDIVGPKYIQHTTPLGGREANRITHDLGVHSSESTSNGLAANGAFPTAKNDNSGTAGKGAASIKIQVAANSTSTACKSDKAAETAKNSISLSANGSLSNDYTESTWLDMNADGLPDKVYASGEVQLNYGYQFGKKEKWGDYAIREGKSQDVGGGLGFNWDNLSFSGGVSLSRTDNHVEKALQDVNGDGLLDIVLVKKPLEVQLNLGAGFAPPVAWNGVSSLDKGESTGESINGSFTFCIHFFAAFVPIFKICINPSGSVGQGTSRETRQLTDINGDGFPDMLSSGQDGEMKVNLSTIGRTNLLKTVHRPLHSSFSMTYELTGNTYAMPQSKWVLTSVETFDGLTGDGADRMANTFAYEDGYYDRCERDFYGFRTVTTQQLDTENNNDPYRIVTQTYKNDSYYEKGLLLRERMTDKDDNPYTETVNTYELRNALVPGTLLAPNSLTESGFPALLETEKRFFEGQPQAGLTNRMAFEYDGIGNVIEYTDYGDGAPVDELRAVINYHMLTGPNILSSPKSIEILDHNSTRLRYREADIDNNGNVTQIRQFLSPNDTAIFDMNYDGFGNLVKITRPENATGERLFYEYAYDPAVQTYVTEVKDAYGYQSSSVYDYAFGQVIESTDLNQQRIVYSLDAKGRVDTITGPYELAAGKPFTIINEYYPGSAVPYAITRHYDPANNGEIVTITFMDGLQRPVQVKKTGALFVSRSQPEQPVMIVSGHITYDAFGRATENHYPVTEASGGGNTTLNTTPDGVQPTVTTYDVLDRKTSVTLPDNATTTYEYKIGDDVGLPTCFITTETDPLASMTINFTDIRGRTRAVKDFGPLGEIRTDFRYNLLSELLDVMDTEGNTTEYTYDQLGRRLSVQHPDAGLTEFVYDRVGNMTAKITPNTRANGDSIHYTYDHERLIQVDYPDNFQNMVRYTYGVPGDKHNRAGRIWLQEDATGGQEFFFGPLGEVVKNIRTILVNNTRMITYVSENRYDTWGRIDTMYYADGEVVTYQYNAAGKLRSVSGHLGPHTYPYVDQLGYDKFEQRAFLRLGNKTETVYAYDDKRRWLTAMTATDVDTRPFMLNTYSYDGVGNILSISNTAPVVNNVPGGPATYNFTYDELYRLSTANGTCTGQLTTETFTLAMTYDDIHNIVRKEQKHLRSGVTQTGTSYDHNYIYSTDRPHIPTRIANKAYTADANGNLTGWMEDLSNDVRSTYWDEENRIKAIWDGGYLSQYTYDAGGERVLKSHGGLQILYTNSEPKGMINHRENFAVYVSPYLVARDKQLTKHVYIEGQRIASKIGAGDLYFAVQSYPGEYLTAGNINYDARMKLLAQAASLGNPAPPTPPNPPVSTSGLPIYQEGQPNFYAYDTLRATNDNVRAGFNAVDGREEIFEQNQYFFHPDHLGSTSYVTDAQGKVRQRVEYLPFGEIFLEEHLNNDPLQPYLYNAKEYDAETGLYYYGARYYDPKLSIWLSVDPMAEKYPGWSPYNYTLLNPVKFVDPDGRFAQMIIGAGIGMSIDYSTQVIGNFINGKRGVDAFTEVNLKSILVSGATGAVGAGIGKWAAKTLQPVAEKAFGAVVDAGLSAANQYLDKGKVDISEVATSVVIGLLIRGPLEDKIKDKGLKNTLFHRDKIKDKASSIATTVAGFAEKAVMGGINKLKEVIQPTNNKIEPPKDSQAKSPAGQ